MLAAVFQRTWVDWIGLLGVSLAFGLTLLTMAFAIGPISGCHINPAVTFGLVVGKRFPPPSFCPTWSPRCLARARGRGSFTSSPRAIPTTSCPQASRPTATARFPGRVRAGRRLLVCELVMSFFFLLVILGTTETGARWLRRDPYRARLTIIHLATIPVTNTSVNPASSTGPALFAARALPQLGSSGWSRSSLRWRPVRRTHGCSPAGSQ